MARQKKPSAAVGQAIRALRLERDLTQESLAHRAGITVGHLSKIERGHSNPTWETVVGIAEALGISLVDVAKAAEDATP